MRSGRNQASAVVRQGRDRVERHHEHGEHGLRDPEAARTRSRRYAKDRPDLNRARRSRRRAAENRAVPSWANKAATDEMYSAAAAAQELFEIPVHVDHTVPLISKLVCGLHCEANLRLLPGRENQAKSNRSWPDMWT